MRLKTTLSACLILVGGVGLWAYAQDDAPTVVSPDDAPVITTDVDPDAGKEDIPEVVMGQDPDDPLHTLDPKTLKPLTEEPTALKQIEEDFSGFVDLLGTVLFYRVGAGTDETIKVEPSILFARGKEAISDFHRVGDPEAERQHLSVPEIRKLEAEGKLVMQGDSAIGNGILGDEKQYEVQYVRLKREDLPFGIKHGESYQKTGSGENVVWRKKLPKRELLSDEQTLTAAQVEQLAEQGLLYEETDAEKRIEKTPWVLKSESGGMPLIVLWLLIGAVTFTIYMRGYNIWGFRHAIDVVRGKYDDPDDEGEVTHFQALASALSATVGLGNIGGVTIAMTIGGPGAFFWMLICGLFGMTSKFVECTLGQKYRHVDADGHVLGGPMRYLSAGLKEKGLGGLGVTLSIIFAIMCVLASFGGGNMYQANQSGASLVTSIQKADRERYEELGAEVKTALKEDDQAKVDTLTQERKDLKAGMDKSARTMTIIYGLILAALVGVVIIGGIKRIGQIAGKIVPTMCILYVLMCLYIILMNLGQVPSLVAQIFTEAFNPLALGGGLVGVMTIGIQRAAFSNEAGVGSAAIAHSAAKTDEPIREGSVALLGPFIDTIIVCSMTALVILITGAWDNTSWVVDQGLQGAELTTVALDEQSPIDGLFPWVLSIAVVLFAYSTIISWSYYGERAWEELFGRGSTFIYKVLAVIAVFIGAIFNLGPVLDFSDFMILSMAFPNILGALILMPGVRADLRDYWRRYKAGEFKTFK